MDKISYLEGLLYQLGYPVQVYYFGDNIQVRMTVDMHTTVLFEADSRQAVEDFLGGYYACAQFIHNEYGIRLQDYKG